MDRFVLVTLALLFSIAPAGAQERSAAGESAEAEAARLSPDGPEARREATLKLLAAMKVEEQYTSTIAQMLSFVDETIQQTEGLTAEEMEDARRLASVALEETMKTLSWDRLGPIFVNIYAEVFTVDEIHALLEFFESPHGQAFIEKQPELTAASMREVGALIGEELPALQARIEAAILEARDSSTEN